MWRSKKSAAPPPPIATQQHGRPSSSFSVLQPTPVNTSGPGAGASPKRQEPKIGRLPVSIHARILSYLPVPEVPRYALGCRALAQLVRTDEGTWKTRCLVLGLEPDTSKIHQSDEGIIEGSPNLSDQNGRAGQHRRGQSSLSSLREMTNPPDAARRPPGAFVFEETGDVQDNDDEFGDFSGSFSASSSTATPQPSGKIATLGKPPTGKKPNGTPNLMDLDGFEDFDFNTVPLPSNAQSPAKKKDRPRSGFFALPAAAPEHPRASTLQRSTGKPPGLWYETYKRVHTELMPYVKILRISSSSPHNPGTTSSSHLTPTQTLALLFPSSHSHDSPVPGSLPLVAQATVLSRLVLFLTPIIEPSADWAWIRRVLIGGGGVIDRWDGGCLSGFENLERRSQASQPEGAIRRTANDDKLVEEMRGVAGASWSVHTALARSKVLSAPSSNRTRNKSNGNGNSTGVSFTTGLGAWGGLGGAEADETSWELGRVWVEKREVFYESGSGGKWDSGENIVYVCRYHLIGGL
jgi:recyclin-1